MIVLSESDDGMILLVVLLRVCVNVDSIQFTGPGERRSQQVSPEQQLYRASTEYWKYSVLSTEY